MRGNTRELAEGLSWPEESATVVDRPVEDVSTGGLEWDTEDGQTLRFGRAEPDDPRAVQWVGMVGFAQGRMPPGPRAMTQLPGVRRLSATAQAFLAAREPVAKPLVAEPYLPDRTERTPRPRLGPKTWMGFAAGMLLASLVLLVVAWIVARSGRAPDVSVAAVAPAPAVTAAHTGASLPAVLEAVDVVTVRATAATTGAVRRAVARGAALRAGEALVELRRPNAAAAQKLAELNELLDEYEDASEHAGEIARARAAYEQAARGPTSLAVRAPHAGVVVGAALRPGTSIAAGEELARLATSVRLVVAGADVDGNGASCHVVLLDRQGVLLDGRLLPSVPEARSRTIVLGSFPADLPLGTIGRVRAICP